MFHDRKTWFETACRRLGTPAGHGWYLAQLKPNSLAIARRNLERQGFTLFVPQRLETRRIGARFRTAPFPLFPGYLFIALDPADARWRAVNSTQGVTRLVSFGGQPAQVPRGLVEEIALGCDAADVLLPPEALAPGDEVRITGGPFAGLLAEVERCDPERRVWVLIDLMGQQTRIQVGREAVRRG